MPEKDKAKWDARYADADAAPSAPSRLLIDLGDLLPKRGRALDIAGGAGRNAIWLAQRGLDVTLADISQVGLGIAAKRATAAGVSLATFIVDAACESLPQGPWDLILCVHYLHRPLFSLFSEILQPCGSLVVIHPTRTNLERNEKPPARFLLEDGELPGLVKGMKIAHYEEGWLAEGRHDAVIIASRPLEG